MNYDIKQSGKRIQQLRINRAYTQDEIAATINIDRSFLSRIESGKKGCSVDMLVQLSEFFQVSLDFLILGKDPVAAQEAERRSHLKEEIANLINLLTLVQEQL